MAAIQSVVTAEKMSSGAIKIIPDKAAATEAQAINAMIGITHGEQPFKKLQNPVREALIFNEMTLCSKSTDKHLKTTRGLPLLVSPLFFCLNKIFGCVN